MNYLAHIFLSGGDRRMQLGNFIGDAVKGSLFNNYPAAIRDGILLHRAIDAYTDRDPSIKAAVAKLKPRFGRYSAALLDIYFDHLLASRFGEFSDIPLRRFAARFYLTMICNYRYLPPRIRRFMWHFIGTDRLTRYATVEGIRQSLAIMSGAGRMNIPADDAASYLAQHETELWNTFLPFFEGVRKLCADYLAAENRDDFLAALRQD